MKSEAYRARKGLYAPDVKSIKSEVRRAGIRLHVSSVSPERGRKVKKNGQCFVADSVNYYVHANLLIAANVRICSLKFSVKKN